MLRLLGSVLGAPIVVALLAVGPVLALTAQQVAKLQPAELDPDDQFGGVVSIDGDTIVVSSVHDDDNGEDAGAAYVFVGQGGTWIQQAKLLAADGEAGDSFGGQVAISGDTIIAGAQGDDDNGDGAGAAYVFVRQGTTWTLEAKLISPSPIAGQRFGRVALDGDTAFIGAASFFTTVTGTYVFERENGVWSVTEFFTEGDFSDFFGSAVAVDGDTGAVGAVFDDDNGNDSGSAFLFVREFGDWTEEAMLLPTDGAAEDRFGGTVDVDGDLALITARGDDDNGTDSGSAYVFARRAGVWTETAKLLAFDGDAVDRFGDSAALQADIVLIGAPGDDDLATDSGAAYLYADINGAWVFQDKVHADDGAASDSFGFSADLGVDTAVIGANFDDDTGSVYVFELIGEPDVPATGSLGIVLLLLAVLVAYSRMTW